MKECADFGYEWNGGMGMIAMIERKWIPSDNFFWDSSNTIDARKSLGIGNISDYVKFSMGLPIGTTLNAIDNKIFQEKYQALLKSMVDYYKANPNKLTVDIIRHCLKVFDSGGAEQEVQGSHVLSSTSQPIASTLQPIISSYFNYSPVKDVLLTSLITGDLFNWTKNTDVVCVGKINQDTVRLKRVRSDVSHDPIPAPIGRQMPYQGPPLVGRVEKVINKSEAQFIDEQGNMYRRLPKLSMLQEALISTIKEQTPQVTPSQASSQPTPEKKSGVSLPVVAGVGVLAYLMFSND